MRAALRPAGYGPSLSGARSCKGQGSRPWTKPTGRPSFLTWGWSSGCRCNTPIRGWPNGRRQCAPGFGFPGVRAWQWANGHGLQTLLPPPLSWLPSTCWSSRGRPARLPAWWDSRPWTWTLEATRHRAAARRTQRAPGPRRRRQGARLRQPRATPKARRPPCAGATPAPTPTSTGATGMARAGQCAPAAPAPPATPARGAATTTPPSAPPTSATDARTPPGLGGDGGGSPTQAPVPAAAGGPRGAHDTPGTLLGTPVAGGDRFPTPPPAPDAGDGPRRGGRGYRRPKRGHWWANGASHQQQRTSQ